MIPEASDNVLYDRHAVYVNAGTSLARIDLASGGTSAIALDGGVPCDGNPQAMHPGLLCLNSDGLGTYTLQVFLPAPTASTPEPPGS